MGGERYWGWLGVGGGEPQKINNQTRQICTFCVSIIEAWTRKAKENTGQKPEENQMHVELTMATIWVLKQRSGKQNDAIV